MSKANEISSQKLERKLGTTIKVLVDQVAEDKPMLQKSMAIYSLTKTFLI